METKKYLMASQAMENMAVVFIYTPNKYFSKNCSRKDDQVRKAIAQYFTGVPGDCFRGYQKFHNLSG